MRNKTGWVRIQWQIKIKNKNKTAVDKEHWKYWKWYYSKVENKVFSTYPYSKTNLTVLIMSEKHNGWDGTWSCQ